ncbi:MAG: alpha/beta fold hydrolase, partial [Chakrabartia sp.]
MKVNGNPLRLSWCNWASNTRFVCALYGLSDDAGLLLPFTRLIAVNSDGSDVKQLGQRASSSALGIRQFDGDVIGWNASDDGQILMSRTYVPENTIGTHLASTSEGLGVDRINTLTLKSTRVEQPKTNITAYIADTNGVVRIKQTEDASDDGTLRGVTRYYYRMADSRDWKPFSEVREGGDGLDPIAIDSAQNIAYAFGKKDGRLVLNKVTLDGQLTRTLVFANDKVDVDRTIRMGRSGRVIGVEFVTDKRETIIFDPEYNALAKRLGKALPGLPLVQFVDASRDEKRLLLFAGSDTDPGRYYIYDKATKRLNEIALTRPQLETVTLSTVKSILYPAADGTMIPAYLTLPPGSTGKGLPALVMPHGGPSARDEWGFDWLSQYFASQGYAVLQPNFRGSSGYGDDWYQSNGFKSWRTAIGDVNDAGRWLIAQGIAQPKKLGIFGWSYGGYAALQSGVLDPDLFKAVVAVAPVTDLRMLINQSRAYTNSSLVAKEVGAGDHIVAGSPLQQVSL